MKTREITGTLTTLLNELVNGAPLDGAYMLNRGDPGLLKSLDRISASEASQIHAGGSSVAAHVDHVRYGLSLMNRWAAGEENPFAEANWGESWTRTKVTEPEWTERRQALRDEAERWLNALRAPRDVIEIELNGMIGSIAHLAYHLGAIRQMDRTLRGPAEVG